MGPKDVDGIANNVDPEQSDLGLHCLPRLVFRGTLRYVWYVFLQGKIFSLPKLKDHSAYKIACLRCSSIPPLFQTKISLGPVSQF